MAGHVEALIQEISLKLDSASLQQLQQIYQVLTLSPFIDFNAPRPQPVEHPVVSGLYYIPNALSTSEERSYIKYMESDNFKQFLKSTNKSSNKESRLVAYFGSNYNVLKSKPDDQSAPQIPLPIYELGQLALQILPRPPRSDGTSWEYNMVVLNRYDGANKQGIGKHIDADGFGHTVISYTFNSGSTMRFTRSGYDPVDVYVKPRSLYIMTGESRSKWAHEMPARASDMVDGNRLPRGVRYSITMRMIDPEWNSMIYI
jgi:alkylated DNA repair dioxygenase AlkB